MDSRAQHRVLVLNHVLAGDLTATEAAAYLQLSLRQVRRLLARYRGPQGVAALVDGNTGRTPANRLADQLRAQLVEFASEQYKDVNRAHLADLLAEREGISVPERTLRRVLAEAGVAAVRRRRRRRGHRARRERMSQAGLLLQVDGSRHDWLQGRGPWLTLVGAIDDATGLITGATFRLQEDAAGYFAAFIQIAQRYGLPLGIYSDRHTIFWRGKGLPTIAEQFSGQRARTQVGTALEAAGIAWIGARSPQAKGRVERLWGTAQDRLISELRLAGAATIDEANAVLADYLPRHNRRLAVAADELRPGLASAARRPPRRDDLLLPPPPSRRRRRHLHHRRPRADDRQPAGRLEGSAARDPGAPRRRPVGSSRRRVLAGPARSAAAGQAAPTEQATLQTTARPSLAALLSISTTVSKSLTD